MSDITKLSKNYLKLKQIVDNTDKPPLNILDSFPEDGVMIFYKHISDTSKTGVYIFFNNDWHKLNN